MCCVTENISKYIEKKTQLDATESFIAAYNMLNMFQALLCSSSGARDLYVCYYRLWCAMPWLLVVEGQVRAAGYESGMKDVDRLQSSNIPHPGRIADWPVPDLRQPETKASHTISGNNTHIVSSSWWWA